MSTLLLSDAVEKMALVESLSYIRLEFYADPAFLAFCDAAHRSCGMHTKDLLDK